MKKRTEKDIALEREDAANYYGERFDANLDPEDEDLSEEKWLDKLGYADISGKKINYIKGKDFLEQLLDNNL